MHVLEILCILIIVIGTIATVADLYRKAIRTEPISQAELNVYNSIQDQVLEKFLDEERCPHCLKLLYEYEEDQCQICGGLTPCHCHEEAIL